MDTCKHLNMWFKDNTKKREKYKGMQKNQMQAMVTSYERGCKANGSSSPNSAVEFLVFLVGKHMKELKY